MIDHADLALVGKLEAVALVLADALDSFDAFGKTDPALERLAEGLEATFGLPKQSTWLELSAKLRALAGGAS